MIDFFKPTKVKLALTMLIPLYIGVVGYFDVLPDGTREIETFLSVRPWPYAVTIIITLGTWLIEPDAVVQLQLLSGFELGLFTATELLLPLVVDYFLACFIVLLYELYKERQKKLQSGYKLDKE